MFVYLSKKIAIPNGVKLKSVSWNADHGWLACGGDDGLLKVLKLEAAVSKDTNVRGIAAQTNLSMNQTLEGHRGGVMVCTWNPTHRKLTTSDGNGLIIVWVLHKGLWYEEMINNRNKSVARDMRWRSNGQEICIAYEDGMVIMGSVDGNRIWSKDVGVQLALVEWSPDGKNLLFGTVDGTINIHNHQGVKLGVLPLPAVADCPGGVKVMSLEWYDGSEGHTLADAPTLAVAFENGRVQIMRGLDDTKPVLIDTGLALVQAKWNSNGTVLALGGTRPGSSSGGKDSSEVQYYTPLGRYITSLKIPGGNLTAITWEGGGLRMALAVDSFVYFANIRPQYRWASFGDCVVYAFARPDKVESCVVFWNIKTGEKHAKFIKRLISIHAAGENCILVARADAEAAEAAEGVADPGAPSSSQHVLILCNAIGSPLDTKYIDVTPDHVAITPFHVAVASTDTLYLWQYRTQVSKLTSVDSHALRRKEGRERVFHVDSIAEGGERAGSSSVAVDDAICCIAASQQHLLVARESGVVQQYSLPMVTLENKFTLRCRPAQMALNSNSTRFGIIDINSVLSLFDMEARTVNGAGQAVVGEHLAFERKDVWAMTWAEDHPELWAVMEKTRMYVFRGAEPEEPVLSSGFISRFRDLTITSVLLDEVLVTPDAPSRATMVIEHEIRSLRDTRTLLSQNGLRDCVDFVEDNGHPRLWRLIAEAALEKLDLTVAEKAFVACSDYPGIQFVKRLRLLTDRGKQKAEVAAYFQRFDEAEALYREMDRLDLAVELRMRVGDWQRVTDLLAKGGGDDGVLTLAYNRLGDYYADRHQWKDAIPHYVRAKNYEALIECYYIVEDFDALVGVIEALPESSPLLVSIAYKLQSVGFTDAAAQAFLKAGDFKGAVDACVLLHRWDRAIELAERYRLPQIEGLLTKYATQLIDSGKTMDAIELYRKANRDTDSAKLLAKLAADTARSRVDPLMAKRLYVLAALEVERQRKRTMDLAAIGSSSSSSTAMTTQMAAATAMGTSVGPTRTMAAMTAAATLNTLMRADAEAGASAADPEMAAASRTLDLAWHGAEALHYLMLAQRQLYSGDVMAAMTTALRLRNYEDVLDPRDIYSLVALTAYYNECFATCSAAFIKLENLESFTQAERESYADLALSIFMRTRPNDPAGGSITCPTSGCGGLLKPWETSCSMCETSFSTCIASGKPILGGEVSRCKVCRHKALVSEIRGRSSCPLCHGALQTAATSSTSSGGGSGK